MRVRRERNRLPASGVFRRIAMRQGWRRGGWTFFAEGRNRAGYRALGMGNTAREAVNDLVRERRR